MVHAVRTLLRLSIACTPALPVKTFHFLHLCITGFHFSASKQIKISGKFRENSVNSRAALSWRRRYLLSPPGRPAGEPAAFFILLRDACGNRCVGSLKAHHESIEYSVKLRPLSGLADRADGGNGANDPHLALRSGEPMLPSEDQSGGVCAVVVPAP